MKHVNKFCQAFLYWKQKIKNRQFLRLAAFDRIAVFRRLYLLGWFKYGSGGLFAFRGDYWQFRRDSINIPESAEFQNV